MDGTDEPASRQPNSTAATPARQAIARRGVTLRVPGSSGLGRLGLVAIGQVAGRLPLSQAKSSGGSLTVVASRDLHQRADGGWVMP